MKENRRGEGLLVRAEPGALLLDADPEWAGAINTVLVSKGVKVDELRKQSMARAASGLKPPSAHIKDDEGRTDPGW